METIEKVLYTEDADKEIEALVFFKEPETLPNGKSWIMEYYDPIISIKFRLSDSTIIINNTFYDYYIKNVDKIYLRPRSEALELEGYGTLLGTETVIYSSEENYE